MIVIAHNRYRSTQLSGENLAVDAEVAALQAAGVALVRLERHSDALVAAGPLTRLRTGLALGGSATRRAALRTELQALDADLVHAHNLFPLFGTDLWQAAHDLGIPLIQTVHNHRLFATATRLLGSWGARRPRDPAEAAHLQRLSPLHGGRLTDWFYQRGLTRAWTQGLPRLVSTWIVHSGFHRDLLVAAGLDPARIVVRLHALPGQRKVAAGDPAAGTAGLFVGRLKPEKGLDLLAAAWPREFPLEIVGDGPEADLARRLAGERFRGALPPAQVASAMARARFLIVASRVYEGGGLPLVALEALAAGTPVLAPALGALPELIAERGVGWCFPPDDPAALTAAIRRAWAEAPDLRPRCQAVVERDHDPARWLAALQAVYAAQRGAAS